MERVGGVGFPLHLTEEGAEGKMREFVMKEGGREGRVNCLVHNAGLTQDKTLRRMKPEQFQQVI